MSLVALAALVPVLVGLPPGASAPAPGALPAGATVMALDRELGIVRVDLPRSGLAGSIARLKAAPGTRYVEADAPLAIAGAPSQCSLAAAAKEPSKGWWSKAIRLPANLPPVRNIVVGIADTGADLERLGSLVGTNVMTRDFTGSRDRADVSDAIGHGTLVTSLIAADRKDLGIQGIAVGAPLALARVVSRNCTQRALSSGLIDALRWFREDVGPSVVSVSITTKPSLPLRESLRALQLGGTLVVAAAGNFGEDPATTRFPWAEPGVLAVGSVMSRTKVAAKSTRSPRIDLVAPGPGVPAIAAGGAPGTSDETTTPEGTSFAAPIVAAAAALVRAKHPAWPPDDVAAALRQSASLSSPLTVPDRAWGWGLLDVTAALRITPQRDLREPNDWAGAAAAQTSLVQAGRPSASVRARIGDGGDRRDLYPVALRGGQRISATARTSGARVRLSLLTEAGGLLGDWSQAGATSSLGVRAPSAGSYLVAVERSSGFGAYRLSLSTS